MCSSLRPALKPTAYLTYVPKSNEERLLLSSATGDLEGVKQMLDAGVDIETRDTGKIAKLFDNIFYFYNTGYTPLHFACKGKKANVAQYLLEAGQKLNRQIYNIPTRGFITPLTVAIDRRFDQGVSLLLQYGVDPRQFPPTHIDRNEEFSALGHAYLDPVYEPNPFIFAIRRGHVFGIEAILNKVEESWKKVAAETIFGHLLTDLGNICLSYLSEITETYVNNFDDFNVYPLTVALDFPTKSISGTYFPTEHQIRVVQLILQAGADPKMKINPTSDRTIEEIFVKQIHPDAWKRIMAVNEKQGGEAAFAEPPHKKRKVG